MYMYMHTNIMGNTCMLHVHVHVYSSEMDCTDFRSASALVDITWLSTDIYTCTRNIDHCTSSHAQMHGYKININDGGTSALK